MQERRGRGQGGGKVAERPRSATPTLGTTPTPSSYRDPRTWEEPPRVLPWGGPEAQVLMIANLVDILTTP